MHIFMGRIFLQVCENEMLNLWNLCMECGHHMRSFLFLALHYKTSTDQLTRLPCKRDSHKCSYVHIYVYIYTDKL